MTEPSAATAGRNLVLCADGTWNRGGPGRPTNVWRLYQAIDKSDGRQICIHDNGVGTGRGFLSKVLGGAFGVGLFGNVAELYAFLIQHYRPGDRIFLFGFSRGAFTVRLLSGLIHECGILDLTKLEADGQETVSAQQAAQIALRAFRLHYARVFRRDQALLGKLTGWLQGGTDTVSAPRQLREGYAHPCNEIEFIGVWDTVRAFGGPFDGAVKAMNQLLCLSFADHELSPNVQRGVHALALDEPRQTFAPIEWEKRDGAPDPRVRQQWFAGAHSNIGGGYEKQELAALTLTWMMDELATAGKERGFELRLDLATAASIRAEGNAHGTLNNPRAGVSAFYRYRPRRVPEGATIHPSVHERIRHRTDGYAPTNLGCRHGADVKTCSFAHSADQGIPFLIWLRRQLHLAAVAAIVVILLTVPVSVPAVQDLKFETADDLSEATVAGLAELGAAASPFDALDDRIRGLAGRIHEQPGPSLVALGAVLLCALGSLGIGLYQRRRARRFWSSMR